MAPTPMWEDFSATPFGQKCTTESKNTDIRVNGRGTLKVKHQQHRGSPSQSRLPNRKSSSPTDTTGTTPNGTTLFHSAQILQPVSSTKEIRDDANDVGNPLFTSQQVEPLVPQKDSVLHQNEVFWCDVTPQSSAEQVTTKVSKEAISDNKKPHGEEDILALSITSFHKLQHASSFGSFLPDTTSWMSFGSGTSRGGDTTRHPIAKAGENRDETKVEGNGQSGKKSRRSDQVQNTDIPTLISLSSLERTRQVDPAGEQESLCSYPVSPDASVSSSSTAWYRTKRQAKKPINRTNKKDATELLNNPIEGVVDVVDGIIDWTLEVLAEDDPSEADSVSTRERIRSRPNNERKKTISRDRVTAPKVEKRPARIIPPKDGVQRKVISSLPESRNTSHLLAPKNASFKNAISGEGNNNNILVGYNNFAAGVKSDLSRNETAHESSVDVSETTTPDSLYESDPEKYAIHRIASALSENSLSMSGKVLMQHETFGRSSSYPESFRSDQQRNHDDCRYQKFDFKNGPGPKSNIVSGHQMATSNTSCATEVVALEDGCRQDTQQVMNANCSLTKCEAVEESTNHLEYLCMNFTIVGDQLCGNVSGNRNQRRITCT
jgi:hypothetical protein